MNKQFLQSQLDIACHTSVTRVSVGFYLIDLIEGRELP